MSVSKGLGDGRAAMRRLAAMIAGDDVYDALLLQALAAERTRLANALHDGPLAQLVLARVAVREVAQGKLTALDTVLERLDRVTGALHDLTGSLHEESLAERPLHEAIEQIASALHGHVGVTLQVDPGVDGHHDDLLRQAARELLSNAVQHAGATMVTLSLSSLCDELHLQVSDDGSGFDPDAAVRARAAGHLGLQRLERAAVRLGGAFSVVTNPSGGTTATMRLPTNGTAPFSQPVEALRPHRQATGHRTAGAR